MERSKPKLDFRTQMLKDFYLKLEDSSDETIQAFIDVLDKKKFISSEEKEFTGRELIALWLFGTPYKNGDYRIRFRLNINGTNLVFNNKSEIWSKLQKFSTIIPREYVRKCFAAMDELHSKEKNTLTPEEYRSFRERYRELFR